MRVKAALPVLTFASGFLLGSAIYSIFLVEILQDPSDLKSETTAEPTTTTTTAVTTTEAPTTTTTATTKAKTLDDLYNHTLADLLYSEVKILCWVFTHPSNHQYKVPHVREMWAKKCNKLIIFSNAADPTIPELVVLQVPEGRRFLWAKTILALRHVYQNYLNEYDWFMRADDDNYIIVENLRHMLYQYNPKTALYMGQRFAVVKDIPNTEEGFMHGAGHVISGKAIRKLFEKTFDDPTLCDHTDTEADDVMLAKCLRWHAIFVNGLDELGQKQFFAISPKEHFKPHLTPAWYIQYLWDSVPTGSLDCCSNKLIMLHYIPPREQYGLDFLINRVHPFGVEKDASRQLPRKLPLDEIIAASDAPCSAPNYIPHDKKHFIDEDEKYQVR